MNKKILTTVIVGVMAMALVSAVLVNYLSNPVTAEVEVKSPIVQSISLDEAGLTYGATLLSLPEMYTGGEKTFTFYVETENIAGESVTGVGENIVTNNLGLTCADFESVSATTTSTIDESPQIYGPYPIECSEIDWKTVEFAYGPDPMTWSAGQVDITEIVVTFNDVIGTYTFTSQVVPTS